VTQVVRPCLSQEQLWSLPGLAVAGMMPCPLNPSPSPKQTLPICEEEHPCQGWGTSLL
jgi:hypothetical protein